MTTLIRNGTIVDFAAGGLAQNRCDVGIDGNQITAVAPNLPEGGYRTVIDASGCLIIPGLVNAHVHSWELPFRGRYDNLPLELWSLYAYPPAAYPELTERFIYLRTMMAALESVRGGVTTIVDDLPELPHQSMEAFTAAVSAYRDVGLRARVSGNITDLPFTRYLPHAKDSFPSGILAQLETIPQIAVDDYVSFCERAISSFNGPTDRLGFFIAPAGPQWCSPDLLTASAELSRRHGVSCHIHVHETFIQALTGPRFFGKSLIRYLEDLGCLAPTTTLIHTVWLDDEDLKAVVASGVAVVHNPISNQKLGAGVAPFARLCRSGVPVGLGTDGFASSDTARVFDVIRATGLVHKLTSFEPQHWPTALEILRAATIGGARAVRLDEELGSLEVGKQADMVLLRLDRDNFTPLNMTANHLVYCEDGSSIDRVIVAGRVLLENNVIQTVDEAALRTEFLESATEVLQRHKQIESRCKELEPYMWQVYERCLAEFGDPAGPITRASS